jgi:hypothetical protein
LAFERQLKSVDLPTFGNPTIPHLRLMFLVGYSLEFCY